MHVIVEAFKEQTQNNTHGVWNLTQDLKALLMSLGMEQLYAYETFSKTLKTFSLLIFFFLQTWIYSLKW